MATLMSVLVATVALAQAPVAPSSPAPAPVSEAAPAPEATPAAPAPEATPAAPAPEAAPVVATVEGVPANEVEAVEQTKSAIDAFQAGQILLGISLLLGVAFFVVKKFVKKN